VRNLSCLEQEIKVVRCYNSVGETKYLGFAGWNLNNSGVVPGNGACLIQWALSSTSTTQRAMLRVGYGWEPNGGCSI